MANARTLIRSLPPAAVVQGLTWVVVVGLWPILAYRSFEKVTGPKYDDWLVRGVAGLGLTVGATLLGESAAGRARSREAALLGIGSAATLNSLDIYYSLKGRISKVYLLDVLAHLPLFALWARDLVHARAARTRASTPEEGVPNAIGPVRGY